MPVTKTMAFDHEPYSMSTGGAPEDVVLAVRSGLGINIFDLDIRELSWHDESCSASADAVQSSRRLGTRVGSGNSFMDTTNRGKGKLGVSPTERKSAELLKGGFQFAPITTVALGQITPTGKVADG